VRWELETDLRAFDARVRPMLEARIENNVPATTLAATLQGQFDSVAPVLAVGVHGDGHPPDAMPR
jgi:glycine cleavage system regulatory protein